MKRQHEIAYAAREILKGTMVRCPGYATKLRTVSIRVSSRMTSTAGTAKYSKNEITLSLPFFADETNFDSHLFETVTHEAAHLVVGLEGRNGQPHGPQFRSVHYAMGGAGKRTHSMDLADGFKARTRKPSVKTPCGCGCGQSMSLGPTQAKKHQSGRAKYMLKGHRPRSTPLPELNDLFRF